MFLMSLPDSAAVGLDQLSDAITQDRIGPVRIIACVEAPVAGDGGKVLALRGQVNHLPLRLRHRMAKRDANSAVARKAARQSRKAGLILRIIAAQQANNCG